MSSTDPGPRDHLITRALEQDLSDLAREVRDETFLETAEAPERLARHAMAEFRRELGTGEMADPQAQRVNAALRQITGEDEPAAEVMLPARLLRGISESIRPG